MRIIAGKYRGRKLSCPKLVTRPTLDRVREALFSILGDLTDQVVVDLYAGSGALGLEALSRGARHVALVEADRGAAEVIRRNAAFADPGSFRILHMPVERARGALSGLGPIDLVLADPPWQIAQDAARVIPEVMRDLLAPHATLVLGHAARDELKLVEGNGFELERCRTWGDSALSFLHRSG